MNTKTDALLDDYRRAIRAARRADMDAYACQTRADWRNRDAAHADEETALQALADHIEGLERRAERGDMLHAAWARLKAGMP